jgi:dihydrodipicolinate synthase/N-acetylneuraminate lyase
MTTPTIATSTATTLPPEPLVAGVWTASACFFTDDGDLDLAAYAEHLRWQIADGIAGIVPNGSLGEYEALESDERLSVLRTAVETIGGDRVLAGVGGKGAAESRKWAQVAADLGCVGVMTLPPTSHAPTADEVVAHVAAVASVGLPVVVYNNPFSTRVDLTPPLLARIADEIPGVVGVKEFSGDVRRVSQIVELAPRLQVICGCDDVAVESFVMGSTGWIAGFSNVFPAQSVALFDLVGAGKLSDAITLYRQMLPILRWDADPRFVQAIKIGLEESGRRGGPVRLPRLALSAVDEAAVREQTRLALGASTGR